MQIHTVSRGLFVLVSAAALGLAQSQAGNQTAATPDELKFFRYVLTTLGSIDASPTLAKMEHDAFVGTFGLNAQEAATIDSAADNLRSVLKAVGQQSDAIKAGKRTLSTADQASIAALTPQLDQAISTQASLILGAVRPETADRLRRAADLVGNATQHK